MKLYKFRPLATCQDLDRAQEILGTGEFWCSKFWELNDPMEGVYGFLPGTLDGDFIQHLFDGKAKRVLCSFSGKEAFADPLMWGYYANGFKGIAIEVDAADANPSVLPVKYVEQPTTILDGSRNDAAVMRVLTSKLKLWEHEQEFRYVAEGDSGPRECGQIRAVYFGNPYSTTINVEMAQGQKHLREYLQRAESLRRLADDNDYDCCDVEMIEGVVKARGRAVGDDVNP